MQTNSPGSLNEKFGNFGAAPTDQLWDSIATSLDNHEKKRRGIFWWWWLGGIAATLLLFFGVFQLGYYFGKDAKTSTGEVALINTNNQSDAQPDATTSITRHQETQPLKTQTKLHSTESSSSYEQFNPSPFQSENWGTPFDTLNENLNETHPIVAEQKNDETSSAVNIDNLPAQKIIRIKTAKDFSKFPTLEKPIASTWEIGFSIGTLYNPRGSAQLSYIPPQNGLADLVDQEAIVPNSGSQSFNGIMPSYGSVSRPLTIDFTIAKKVSPLFSLQSGIGMNYMRAVTRYTTYDTMQVNASFFNLSIPMVGRIHFIDQKKLTIGGSIGIVHEIPLVNLTRQYDGNNLENFASTKSFTKGYMLSTVGQINIGVKLNDRMNFEFSPGMRYYLFQSLKTPYPVIERKLWLGASAGIVWKI